jgi:hypothetical protein
MRRPRLLYRLGRMTGFAAASSTLGSSGLGELRRATPTAAAGLDTDAGVRAGEGCGVSTGSSGRKVPWIATGAAGGATFWAGVCAALMKSSEVAFSGAGAEAVSSG